MDTPSAVTRAAVLLEKQPVTWRRAHGGYTPAERWLVDFADGSSCFVKAGVTPYTAGALRDEYNLVYSRLDAPFLPQLLGWEDDDVPLLLLEDLRVAHWPPPWTREQVDTILRTLDAVHAIRLPGLPAVNLVDTAVASSWKAVQANTEPFLALGLCSEGWLRRAIGTLVEAEQAGQEACAGEELLHVDIRSDNLCFDGERVVLIDWNWAARGSGELDIASWLPSLHSEGGPAPEEILPNAPHWAALISGYFAAQAGLPGVPDAPRVRAVQLAQLRSALPWAQRALGLPRLDGAEA